MRLLADGCASCYRIQTMNLLSFMLVLAGVLLNAAAQLLLKAGTNGDRGIRLYRRQPGSGRNQGSLPIRT